MFNDVFINLLMLVNTNNIEQLDTFCCHTYISKQQYESALTHIITCIDINKYNKVIDFIINHSGGNLYNVKWSILKRYDSIVLKMFKKNESLILMSDIHMDIGAYATVRLFKKIFKRYRDALLSNLLNILRFAFMCKNYKLIVYMLKHIVDLDTHKHFIYTLMDESLYFSNFSNLRFLLKKNKTYKPTNIDLEVLISTRPKSFWFMLNIWKLEYILDCNKYLKKFPFIYDQLIYKINKLIRNTRKKRPYPCLIKKLIYSPILLSNSY